MLLTYLSGTGAPVEIPEAVDCLDCEDSSFVTFVDDAGRALVRFRRADVSMFATAEQAVVLTEPAAKSSHQYSDVLSMRALF